MKITIEIPDDEIREEAKKIVAEKIADDIYGDYRSGKYCYRNAIKDIVREVIKGDIDNLSDRAVAAAGKSIENRAVKKLIEKLGSEL